MDNGPPDRLSLLNMVPPPSILRDKARAMEAKRLRLTIFG